MNPLNTLLSTTKFLVLLGLLGLSMNTEAGLFGFGGDSWKEEVLLHDGSTIIVSRSQSYGGGHKIGQSSPINKDSFSFTMPETHQLIAWKETLIHDPESESLIPLALDIVNGVTYLLASPVGEFTNNKWGCSNSHYIVLEYAGQRWKQISMSELPSEIKTANLVISTETFQANSHHGLVTIDEIKELNKDGIEPSLKTFVREPPNLPTPQMRQAH